MRLLLNILVLFCFSISNVSAQDQTDQAPDFEYGPILKVEMSKGGIHYEYRIKKRSSVSLIATFDWRYFLNPDYYAFQISPEYRFYLSKKRDFPHGFYIGSYLFYKKFIVARDLEQNESIIYSKDEIRTSGIGVKPGYHFAFTKTGRWIIDLGLGFGYNIFREVNHIEGLPIIDEETYRINFSGNVAIGYLFKR